MLFSMNELKKQNDMMGPFYVRKAKKIKVAKGVREIPVGTTILVGGVFPNGDHVVVIDQGIEVFPAKYGNRKMWELSTDEPYMWRKLYLEMKKSRDKYKDLSETLTKELEEIYNISDED